MPLSYLQLIEVAVVATLRGLGVPLRVIRLARSYAVRELNSQYPFAEYQFQTDGINLFLKLKDLDRKGSANHLIVANKWGVLAWNELMSDRLAQFEYEQDVAMRWYVRGRQHRVVIDPRVAFGQPTVGGIPTWTVRGRFEGGESIAELVDDFQLTEGDIKEALVFEGVLEAV